MADNAAGPLEYQGHSAIAVPFTSVGFGSASTPPG